MGGQLGGFSVSATAGRSIMDAIRAVRAELESQRQNLELISREPWLGSTPGGRFVSGHAQKIALGSPQSLRTVLEQAEAVLDDLEAGIGKAMAAYGSVDSVNNQALNRAGEV